MNKFAKIANALVFKTQKEFETRNYITAFEKMILTFIQIKKYSHFSKQQFKDEFASFFSLKVTNLLISNFLNTLVSKGYLKKRSDDYEVVDKNIEKENLAKNYEKINDEMKLFVKSFEDFYNHENNYKISSEKCEEIICEYIETMVSRISIKKDEDTCSDLSNDCKIFEYFISLIAKENSELYEIYKGVFLGRIFTSVMVENEITPENELTSFKGLNIYLDSDFMFNSLGLNYYSSSEEYISMINTLKEMGASLYIFEHTFEEMRRIILNSVDWIGNSRFDQTVASKTTTYFVLKRSSQDEVYTWYYELEGKINSLGITIDKNNKIDYNEKDLSELYLQNIFNRITNEYKATDDMINAKYDTYNADAKSLYSIHKLRKGNASTSLKNAKYLFVTHNYALCKVANDITYEKYDSKTIPLAFNDRLINVLLWFSIPQYKDSNNIMFLIPCIHNAFEPSKEMIQKIYTVCEKLKNDNLITDSALFDWKTNPVLQQNFIDYSRNNPCKIDSSTPTFILKQYEVDAEKKYIAKTNAISNFSEKRIGDLTKQINILEKNKKFFTNVLPQMLYWTTGLLIASILFGLAILLFSIIQPDISTVVSSLVSAIASLIIGYIATFFIYFIKIRNNDKSKINRFLRKIGLYFFRKRQLKIDSLNSEIKELNDLSK